jgi:2-dehydro-3-deoxyphosphogluconate aldolase/(4S)-4-hydroxy-2-oxoglutarate aldolase
MLEVTFDHSSEELRLLTARTIRRLNEELGGEMVFGAGTVTTPEMVRMAFEAGAKFIISPDMDPAVIKETLRLGMVSIPGAFTPTEIKQAHACGADFVKVFPASKLGPSYIKDVTAPLNNVRLLAVGGVDGSNIRDYLAAGAVGAGVAGCLFKKDWIRNGEWDRITEASRRFTAALRGDE